MPTTAAARESKPAGADREPEGERARLRRPVPSRWSAAPKRAANVTWLTTCPCAPSVKRRLATSTNPSSGSDRNAYPRVWTGGHPSRGIGVGRARLSGVLGLPAAVSTGGGGHGRGPGADVLLSGFRGRG